MSLNRYEQAVFNYWTNQPEERRHWQTKAHDASQRAGAAGQIVRELERELWDYFVERRAHVAALRDLQPAGSHRISLLNLAEHIIRVWGVPPKPRKPDAHAG